MYFQVTADFAFEPVLEHGQHKPELGHDVDLFSVNLDAAINSGALKKNRVFIPTVVDVKFISQILGQLVSRILGVLTTHLVPGMNVNGGHGSATLSWKTGSLVSVADRNQSFRPVGAR